AYNQSSKIASVVGPFKDYDKNKQDFNRVIKKHIDQTEELKPRFKFVKQIHQKSKEVWSETLNLIYRHGSRNSQAVVIAPTGTIMFLMGTVNNGIEPPYSLVSYKLMSDGSSTELLCEEAKISLKRLGYSKTQIKNIWDYVKQNGDVEGSPDLNPAHLPIFNTASSVGDRSISPLAHVQAVAAATPFISGGISKTINLPEDATPQDVWDCYVKGWELGCKGLALYRSGSKWSQPLNISKKSHKKEIIQREIERSLDRLSKSDFNKTNFDDIWQYNRGMIQRKRAANRAPAERLNFKINGENIWINIVRYPDNGISEIWLEVGKEDPTVNGLADTIGRIISIAVQYGVPVEAIAETMSGLQFNPSGFMNKNDLGIRHAKSLSDLTAKVLLQLNEEYNGKKTVSDSIISDKLTAPDTSDSLNIVSEADQAKNKGYSGVRCENCGSWKCVGTVKCGSCLDCQSAYGTCSG
ncbi:MAG: hypothetical protein ACOCV1_03605, partial [Bacillota bacterium]